MPSVSGHANPVVHAALDRRAAYFASKADALFNYELYTVPLYEGWSGARNGSSLAGLLSVRSAWELLSVRRAMTVLSGELTRAVTHLHTKAQAFQAHLSDTVMPRLLAKEDIFSVLRMLLNPAPHKAEAGALKYDTHLDFFAADSTVECERDTLRIDDYRVKVLTMKEPPSRTFAHVLEDLQTVPSRFVACLEWQRLSNVLVQTIYFDGVGLQRPGSVLHHVQGGRYDVPIADRTPPQLPVSSDLVYEIAQSPREVVQGRLVVGIRFCVCIPQPDAVSVRPSWPPDRAFRTALSMIIL